MTMDKSRELVILKKGTVQDFELILKQRRAEEARSSPQSSWSGDSGTDLTPALALQGG